MKASTVLQDGLNRLGVALRQDWQDHVTQHTLTVFGGHGIRLALGLVSSALLARALGPVNLSVFSIVSAATMIAVTLGDFGLSQSAIRSIAGALPGYPLRAKHTAGAFAQLKLVGGLATAAALVLLSGPLTDLLRLPKATAPTLLLLAALGLLATSTSGLFSAVLQANKQFLSLVGAQTVNATLTVILMVALYVSGRLTVAGALIVGIVSALGAAALGWRSLPDDLRPRIVQSWKTLTVQGLRLWRFGRWLWLSHILIVTTAQLDLLLLNRFLDPLQVGYYALALNLSLKADMVNQTLHTVLLPVVSALTRTEEYRRYVRQNLARNLFLAALMLLALPLARPFILMVYGPEFAPAFRLFTLLMVVVVFDLVLTPHLLLAYPLDAPRQLATTDGLQVATLFLLGIWLIPIWGVEGAVAAKLGARLVGGSTLALILMRRYRSRLRAERMRLKA